ncbi:MAG: thiamine phosphate synthase [Epsilonproteobacteria bacterium]|nr:thiamine phosphate synthase [Campylobacterota bacterium]
MKPPLRYKITDPLYYGRDPVRFFSRLSKSKRSDLILLRDKENPKLRKLAARFVKRYGKRGCISKDLKLARRFGFGCIHLNAHQLGLIKRVRRKGVRVIYSAHTPDEVRRAVAMRADFITFSPIFSTPGKGRAVGVRALRRLTRKYKNIIALGGILTRSQVHAVMGAKARGYASIRHFL